MSAQEVGFQLPGLAIVIEVRVLERHIRVTQMWSQEANVVLRLRYYSVFVDLIKAVTLRNLYDSNH